MMPYFSVKHSWIAIGVLLLAAGPACHKPVDSDPDIVVTLPPEFTVDLFETRDAATGAPNFGLWVTSMDTFDCSNYRIESSVDVSGGGISVRLLVISPPDSCEGPPAPAAGFIPIGLLGNGNYPFTFSLSGAIENKGTLRVKDGHYELTMTAPQGVDFQNRVLESIPEGLIWGYAAVPSETDLPIAGQFFTQLKTISIEQQLPPGFYGYFTVAGTGQFYFHRSVAPAGQNLPFLRELTGTADDLRNILKSYREDPSHPLQLKCLSTQGEF